LKLHEDLVAFDLGFLDYLHGPIFVGYEMPCLHHLSKGTSTDCFYNLIVALDRVCPLEALEVLGH